MIADGKRGLKSIIPNEWILRRKKRNKKDEENNLDGSRCAQSVAPSKDEVGELFEHAVGRMRHSIVQMHVSFLGIKIDFVLVRCDVISVLPRSTLWMLLNPSGLNEFLFSSMSLKLTLYYIECFYRFHIPVLSTHSVHSVGVFSLRLFEYMRCMKLILKW